MKGCFWVVFFVFGLLDVLFWGFVSELLELVVVARLWCEDVDDDV